MATSGYSDVYVTKWDTLRFNWSRSSYSIENNTSTINWSLQLIATSYGAINSSPARAWSVTICDVSYSGSASVNIGNNTTKTLASGSTTIYHNADGTRVFPYSFSQAFNITFSGSYIGTVSGSGTGTVDTIPRTSSVSATDATIGNATTITIYRASSSFTHTLRYSFCNLNEAIVNKTSATSYSWTLPNSFYAQIPNSKSSWATLYCDTYSGSTLLGTSSCTFNIYANEGSCKPALSPTVVDQGTVSTTLTGDVNKIIKHYNTVNVTFNASAKNSATISSMKVTCGNTSRTSDGLMRYVDSGTFVFTVTDSRGYSTSKTITKEIIDYIPLTCNLSTDSDLVDGSTANINLTVKGKYYSGSFGAVTNSLTVEYRYKTNNSDYPTDSDGNEVWTSLAGTIYDGEYTAQTTIEGLNYTNSYTFQARAKDAPNAGGVVTKEQVVKIVPTFDWSENDFNFNVPVHGAGGFTYNIPIKKNADCNSFTTSGVWYLVDPTANSRPVGVNNGWLQSFVYEGVGSADTGAKRFIYQRYIPAQSISSASICERVMIDGNWSSWEFETLRCYPINSIYISYSHTSPASLFGGTWTRIQNTFLWGCDPDGAIGVTGGESTHVLGHNEMPWHYHTGLYYTGNGQSVTLNSGSIGYALKWAGSAGNGAAELYTGAAGNTEAHNNMPPFIQVSIWRRTA